MTKRIKPFEKTAGWWQAVYIAPVRPPFLWVEEDTFINFKGYNLLLTPAVEKAYPTVYLNTQMHHPAGTPKEPINIILEFLSAFAWISEQQFEIRGTGASQYLIKHVVCEQYIQPYKHFYFEDIPEITDKKSQLALALYREARSVTHPAYQFLGFYKIINLIHPTSKQQMEWINNNIAKTKDQQAKERLKELQKTESDIGNYLYASCRCAISHASITTTVINPDDYNDYKRMYWDLPLIEELARLIITQDLGIESRRDIFLKHLYELSGFKTLLPQSFIKKLEIGQKLLESDFPEIPNLSIRLNGYQPFELLENLNARICAYGKKAIAIECYSNEKLFKTNIFLNFDEERLHTDWFSPENVFLGDDGTPEACDHMISFLEFQKAYLLNGALEVWDADQYELLGRCDPFMPVNCMPNLDWFKQEFEKLSKLKQDRQTQQEITSETKNNQTD